MIEPPPRVAVSELPPFVNWFTLVVKESEPVGIQAFGSPNSAGMYAANKAGISVPQHAGHRVSAGTNARHFRNAGFQRSTT